MIVVIKEQDDGLTAKHFRVYKYNAKLPRR